MNQTIYFNKDVWEKFQDEQEKSKLINRLLREHYEPSYETVTRVTSRGGTEAKDFEMPKIRPLVEVIDDEPEEDFYANLILDTVAGGVFDTEDGERVDADPEMIKELKKRGQVR